MEHEIYDMNKKENKYPVIAWWHSKYRYRNGRIHCSNRDTCNILVSGEDHIIADADAYIIHGEFNNINSLPSRHNCDVIWGIFHDESPKNNYHLNDEDVLNLFNYSATFSVNSDVPFPLLYARNLASNKHVVNTASKNSQGLAPVIYFQSFCDDITDRHVYVKKLMEYIEIDSYGDCLNNREPPMTINAEPKMHYSEEVIHFFAKYKFAITVENGVCEGYVSEKLWRAIEAGTVPVYFGSTSIRDWLPNAKSAILIEDHPTPALLSQHLQQLIANDSLYEEYLEHKTKGVIQNQRLIYEFRMRPYQNNIEHYKDLHTTSTFECYICHKLYQMKLYNYSRRRVVNRNHWNCPNPTSVLKLREFPPEKTRRFLKNSIALKKYDMVDKLRP